MRHGGRKGEREVEGVLLWFKGREEEEEEEHGGDVGWGKNGEM